MAAVNNVKSVPKKVPRPKPVGLVMLQQSGNGRCDDCDCHCNSHCDCYCPK